MHRSNSPCFPSRKRRRNSGMVFLAAAVATAFLIPGLNALSSRTTLSNGRRSLKAAPPSIYQPNQHLSIYDVTKEREPNLWYDIPESVDNENDEFLEDNDSLVEALQELQRSTGSDVLQSDLQRQIDQVTDNPNSFLDEHVKDASYMEKIAMSSITEQLPQAAVAALSKKRNDLQFAKKRVTPEQEVLLARTIQMGAALQALKHEAERNGRSLSRAAWASMANLSPKELRRQISQYRQAKQILVTANVGLVHAVVNQQWNQYARRGVSKEELIQEGSLGLLRAAELFDPNRGLRFSTYAVVWIKGVLQNTHLPELVRLPQREKTKWNKMVQAQHDLEAEGRQGTVEEIAAMTGLTVADVLATRRRMDQTKAVLSLDSEQRTQSRSGAESSMQDFQNNKAMRDSVEEALKERTQLQADLIAALARNLDAREARLVRLRYGLSDGVTRSIAECADAMGLSRTRVQQLNQQCLDKLRQADEAQSLQEYLLTIA